MLGGKDESSDKNGRGSDKECARIDLESKRADGGEEGQTDRFKCRMRMKRFRWYSQCISFCIAYSFLISVSLGSPPTNADECVS